MSLLQVSDFVKTNYLPGLNNQLENAEGTLLGVLGKEAVKIEGGETIMKLRVGDSLGQGTITEAGDFTTPGDPDYDEASLQLSRLNHSINLTMDEVDLLNSKNAAAEAIVTEKMTAAQEAMQRDIIRQTWGNGSGVLANVDSASGSTVTFDATTTDQVDRDRYIWTEAGRMRYDVVHGTTGAQQVTGFEITDIDESTNIATANATMTGATSAGVLVRSGDWASGGAFRSLEFDGIQSIIDDSNTFLGIDRTASGKGYWKSVVKDNGGTQRALTNALIHELLNGMARRATAGRQPAGKDYCAFGSYGVWTAYHETMTPGLRYTLADSPDIGWGKGLEMMGLMLYKDIHAPKNGIWVVHKPSVQFVHAKHEKGGLLKFLDRGGDIWFQGNAASGPGHSAQVFAYLTGMLGMSCKRPRNHGVLKDITEVGV